MPSSPEIAGVVPGRIDALVPGEENTITIHGTGLDLAARVLLNGVPVDPARTSILGSSTITLDMPQVPAPSVYDVGVSDGFVTDTYPITVEAPATPRYELGNGGELNPIDRDDGLSLRLGGRPGRVQRVYASFSPLPSASPYVTLGICDRFSSLFFVGQYLIPAPGWLQVSFPAAALPDPGATGTVFYSQTIDLTFPAPLDASNVQSILMVR